tara:strand:- start:144 stop:1019 length:876 start_codon:yes stop_codon:yes gene_type:complete
MAWKFKQEHVKDGDVVEPSEWRININESFSEINGFLDSDNIARDAITAPLVKRETFTAVRSGDRPGRHSYIFNHDHSGWVDHAMTSFSKDMNKKTAHNMPGLSSEYYSDDSSDQRVYPFSKVRLPSSTFTPDEDGLLIIDFSGWVDWTRYSSHPVYIDNVKDLERGYSSNSYGYFAKQTKYYKSVNALILCSMWRITVNGQSVAESGPLGNDYSSHPIYLCGATPILKSTQARVQVEAKFVWYSPGSDEYIDSSSFAPINKIVKNDGGGNTTYRRDVCLNCPQLIVTYRKR